MAGPAFICKTDRAGLTPLLLGTIPAIQRSEQLHQGLAQRFGREVSNLFAEPVASSDGNSISWYAEGAGEPQPFASLDLEKRRAPEAALRAQLEALRPALSDSTLGPLLNAALFVASLDDILVIDGRPLITNWGFVPSGVSVEQPQELAQHYASTLGRYAPFPAPRLDGVLTNSTRDPVTSSTPPRVPAPAVTATVIEPRLPWRAPLIAVAVAAAILLYLSWPHVLRAWYGNDSGALQRARELNDLLAAKIASVGKSLESTACAALNSDPNLPPGDAQQTKAPPVAMPPGVKPPRNLAEYLDNAVVMVVAEVKPGDYQLGSGFFVSPKTLVTNFHVVKGASSVSVINTMLGKLTPVAVRAHTNGTAPNADFAVLEIAADGPSGPPMTLSTEVERMQDVVVAGYPGITTQIDARRERLLRGDVTAIPQMSDSPGNVMQTLFQQSPALIAINTPISRGNSGGPLVDKCGHALGLATFGVDVEGDKAYYSLGAKTLMAFLDDRHITYTPTNDACPAGSAGNVPSGGAPNGAARNATAPNGAAPNATAPNGAAPPGSAPSSAGAAS